MKAVLNIDPTQQCPHHDNYCLSCNTEQPDTHIENEPA